MTLIQLRKKLELARLVAAACSFMSPEALDRLAEDRFITDRGHYTVGPINSADGGAPASLPRYGKTGETVIGQSHGKYFEASHRGVLFSACEQGTGIAPGTALGTTAFFSLYNPVGSGKRLAVKKVRVGYISGTLGAGTLYHCVDKTTTQVAPSAGTGLTPVCSDVGNGSAPVGLARVNSTVAATLVAYSPFASLDASLATTVSTKGQLYEDVDGEIVVEPGCSYQLQAVAAAGTSPKLTVGVTWEEVSII